MDPIGWGTALSGVITLIVGVVGYMRYKRGKREKLAQAEADELRHNIERADKFVDAPLKLRVDKDH